MRKGSRQNVHVRVAVFTLMNSRLDYRQNQRSNATTQGTKSPTSFWLTIESPPVHTKYGMLQLGGSPGRVRIDAGSTAVHTTFQRSMRRGATVQATSSKSDRCVLVPTWDVFHRLVEKNHKRSESAPSGRFEGLLTRRDLPK